MALPRCLPHDVHDERSAEGEAEGTRHGHEGSRRPTWGSEAISRQQEQRCQQSERERESRDEHDYLGGYARRASAGTTCAVTHTGVVP